MLGATLGNYRIISEIGSGGMGVVYLAEHTLIGRKAAVKLLRADMPEEYVERFFNEAKAAASLDHPGLVDVFDFGYHTDGSAFIVMEFLAGESLHDRLERERRLPIPLALSITRSVANALHLAHDQGIIHRDLKPGNIFLAIDPEAVSGIRPKVLDFGIAKLLRERDVRSVKTQSGAVIGTPRYMSPEQCKNARTVDGRSDIYSLGCMLYEMVLGVPPFDYDSWAELVGAHIYEVPAKPSEVDAKIAGDLETLITTMLEKSPDDRFKSMKELAQSVEVLLMTFGDRPRPTPPLLARPAGMKVGSSRPPVSLGGAFADTEVTPEERAQRNARASDVTMASTPASAPIVSARASSPAPLPAAPVPAPRSGKPWTAIAIAGAGLVALGVAGALVLSKRDKPASETAFIVVDHSGSGVQDSSATPRAVEPAALLDAGPAVVEAAPDAAVPAETPVKRPTETDVAALTRTFAKQNGAITACFKKHGEASEQLTVRIQIDKVGAVQAAEVLPAAAGTTPLGTCIVDVAKHTQFGPQPKAAAFRVPLHTNAP